MPPKRKVARKLVPGVDQESSEPPSQHEVPVPSVPSSSAPSVVAPVATEQPVLPETTTRSQRTRKKRQIFSPSKTNNIPATLDPTKIDPTTFVPAGTTAGKSELKSKRRKETKVKKLIDEDDTAFDSTVVYEKSVNKGKGKEKEPVVEDPPPPLNVQRRNKNQRKEETNAKTDDTAIEVQIQPLPVSMIQQKAEAKPNISQDKVDITTIAATPPSAEKQSVSKLPTSTKRKTAKITLPPKKSQFPISSRVNANTSNLPSAVVVLQPMPDILNASVATTIGKNQEVESSKSAPSTPPNRERESELSSHNDDLVTVPPEGAVYEEGLVWEVNPNPNAVLPGTPPTPRGILKANSYRNRHLDLTLGPEEDLDSPKAKKTKGNISFSTRPHHVRFFHSPSPARKRVHSVHRRLRNQKSMSGQRKISSPVSRAGFGGWNPKEAVMTVPNIGFFGSQLAPDSKTSPSVEPPSPDTGSMDPALNPVSPATTTGVVAIATIALKPRQLNVTFDKEDSQGFEVELLNSIPLSSSTQETQLTTQDILGSEPLSEEVPFQNPESGYYDLTPLCPELITCTDKIDPPIIDQLCLPRAGLVLFDILGARGIHTVGDLSRQTERDVLAWPVVEPKADTIRTVLAKYRDAKTSPPLRIPTVSSIGPLLNKPIRSEGTPILTSTPVRSIRNTPVIMISNETQTDSDPVTVATHILESLTVDQYKNVMKNFFSGKNCLQRN